MASTFPIESASSELLACILEGAPWPDYLLRRALIENDGRLLFSVVIERLGDLFEPALCDAYSHLFTRVVELLRPEWKAVDLLNRYERIRQIRPCKRTSVQNIFVLSRVTLGADVAVTSVLMDALIKKFPDVPLHFVGPRKNYELFAANPRIHHQPFAYPRTGSLAERLAQWVEFAAPDSIVVDPDSRLTQLGILPVCPEEDYFFFESRSCGGHTDDALPVLASRWAREVFGVGGSAFIAVDPSPMEYDVAVSLGVGENSEKRIDDPFEENWLRGLVGRGQSVVVDEGGGGEETARVRALADRIPGLHTFHGSFATFAGMIQQAGLYAGYDSAGQHVAAACGTPLVSVFTGHSSDRMFERWKPWGSGARAIVKVTDRDPAYVLRQAEAATEKVVEVARHA